MKIIDKQPFPSSSKLRPFHIYKCWNGVKKGSPVADYLINVKVNEKSSAFPVRFTWINLKTHEEAALKPNDYSYYVDVTKDAEVVIKP